MPSGARERQDEGKGGHRVLNSMRDGRILLVVSWQAYLLGIATPILGLGSVALYGYWLKRQGDEKLHR
jgi:hypothetical protein